MNAASAVFCIIVITTAAWCAWYAWRTRDWPDQLAGTTRPHERARHARGPARPVPGEMPPMFAYPCGCVWVRDGEPVYEPCSRGHDTTPRLHGRRERPPSAIPARYDPDFRQWETEVGHR